MTEKDIGDRLLTQREYAEYRRCSIRTIERERADRIGCTYIRIGERILYRRADIEQFVDEHRIGSGAYRGDPAIAPRDPRTVNAAPPQSTNTSAAPHSPGRSGKQLRTTVAS